MKDIVVVGGGPAGSYTGWKLAEMGFDVEILEEHPEIGHPMCCAGILGVESLEKVGLDPDSWKISELKAGTFHFPDENPIILSRDRTEAVVIDRAGFDRDLAERAASAGAEFELKTRCKRVVSERDKVILELEGETEKKLIESRMVIGADGTNSNVARSCGLMRKFSPLVCAQAEIEGSVDTQNANVYFNNDYSETFFGWLVPAGGVYRVGVGDKKGNIRSKLSTLIDNITTSEDFGEKIIQYTTDLIPEPNSRRIHDSNRVLLVGDAAGQVKPLTGGGIYMGLSCAQIASEVTEDALSRENPGEVLKNYEKRVDEKFGSEFDLGLKCRSILKEMSNEDLSDLADLMENPEIQGILLDNLDFDHHSNVIKELVGKGPKVIKSIGARRAMKYLNWFSYF